MSTNLPAIRFSGVSRHFGEVRAVDGVDLEVRDGEFFSLLGPSGSGKTTCLRMIAGFDHPTAGTITLYGQDVTRRPPYDRDVNTVFQDYALFPHMSVGENIGYGLMIKKVPRAERARRVAEMLDLVRLPGLAGRRPSQLSGGQRQRVALGRAVVRSPKVFLFDEPLSNLDAKLRTAMRAELLSLHQRLKTTSVYVTHDQMEAMTMADRIAVLKDGILQQIDTPQNLYDHPGNIFVAGFIGSPSMNFFNATITGSGDELFVDAGAFRVKITPSIRARMKDGAGKKVIFGIRPEDIYFPGFVAPGVTTVDVESTVDVTELMGNEIIMYLMAGNNPYLARVDPRARVKVGEKVSMAFNADKVHLFDAEAEGQPTLLKS